MEEQTKQERRKRPFVLKKKHRKFLEKYAELGDIGAAYLAAGYRCATKKIASNTGGKLLDRLEQNIDWQQIVNAVCPNYLLAKRLTELLRTAEGRVAVNAGGHLSRAKGWTPPEGTDDRRIQIVINAGGYPTEIQNNEEDQKVIDIEPVKPKQIID